MDPRDLPRLFQGLLLIWDFIFRRFLDAFLVRDGFFALYGRSARSDLRRALELRRLWIQAWRWLAVGVLGADAWMAFVCVLKFENETVLCRGSKVAHDRAPAQQGLARGRHLQATRIESGSDAAAGGVA